MEGLLYIPILLLGGSLIRTFGRHLRWYLWGIVFVSANTLPIQLGIPALLCGWVVLEVLFSILAYKIIMQEEQ